MPRRKPHIYLDTNVILDVIEDRWDPSRDLIAEIVQRNWLCSTSRFTVLEMLDARQEDAFMRKLLAEGFTLSQIVRRLGSRRTGKFQLRSRELDEIYADLAASIDAHVSLCDLPRTARRTLGRGRETVRGHEHRSGRCHPSRNCPRSRMRCSRIKGRGLRGNRPSLHASRDAGAH